MNIYLATYAVQCLLSLLFLYSGSTKVFLKGEKLKKWVPISVDVPEKLLRKIGVAEMAVSFGLAMAAGFEIFPILALFADAGIVFLMIGAIVYHFTRKQWGMLVLNLFVTVMALFAIYEMLFTKN